MRHIQFVLTVAAFVVALLGGVAQVRAADIILSGSVKSASGEAVGGVMVSAKPQGGTITTTVLTDETGRYYFPPLAAGKYRLWAQALSFERDNGDIDLGAAKQHDFTLAPMADFFKQLPGNLMLAALPEENEQDKRMKRIVPTIAPPATPAATCCNIASTKPAGMRSSS